MDMVRTACAKLNLALGITGLAPNGYHWIDSAMHTIDLCDQLRVRPADTLTLRCAQAHWPMQADLTYKAAALLQRHTGVRAGANMELIKRIPVRAGLGGGSANAAAALLALNELWGTGLSTAQLCELALQLGADTPFALHGGTARVRGIGGELEPLGAPALHFALAMPAQGLDTAQVYRLYDTMADTADRPDMDAFCRALAAGDVAAMAASGGNALRAPAQRLLPDIALLISALERAGAQYAGMTGSGSAVFGVFASQAQAQTALASLGTRAAWSACAASV